MSLDPMLSETSSIYKFLVRLKFLLFFTKPAFQHIQEFVQGSTQKGYKGTVTDIVKLSYALCHRTSFGKFLSKGSWNEEYAWKAIQKETLRNVYEHSKRTKEPIFAIYDDTIAEKTKPSSQAESPIEGTNYNHSHLKGKCVWSHQILSTLLSCGDRILPYKIERYEKGGKSKIDRVCEVVETLPVPDGPAYGLCDSWFPCPRVIDAHFKRGYHLIGGLKTNRVIYPQGIHQQIQQFAQYIEKNDVHLVTVKGSSYWVYRYEGALNGIDNAVVLMCWRKKAFKAPKALHAFLCTDVSLDTQTILNYYSKRWPIEIFFRQTKGNLGLNTYQIRSIKAIDRLLVLIALSYLYCVIGTVTYRPFGVGIQETRKITEKERITWIYTCAKNNIPLPYILNRLKVS